MSQTGRASGFNPALDHAVIERLLVELGGDAAARDRFLLDFIELWQERLARLCAAVTEHDSAEASVVVLSIGTSAKMVGATALAALAVETYRERDAHWLKRVDARLDAFAALGQAACSQLEQVLVIRR